MMEAIPASELVSNLGKILCCQCGTPIDPNPANLCVACLRIQVDITEGIPKQVSIRGHGSLRALTLCDVSGDDTVLQVL